MQLSVGSYAVPANCARIGVNLDNEHDDLGRIVKQTIRWDCAGELFASGQAAVVAACVALENALKQPRPNIVFRQDSGAVAMALTNAGSIGGVRIKNLRYVGENGGFEYVNGRTFAFTAEATYTIITNQAGAQLLTFTETVETFGGGPVKGFMRPVNSQPIEVTLYTHSVFEASQTGQATCLLGYWPVPPPVLGIPVEAPRIGRSCDGKTFVTTWSYRFQKANGPFLGLPTIIR